MERYGDPGQIEELLHGLFGSDLVLPEQFYEARRSQSGLSGEMALMWAVLADGIEVFCRTARAESEEEQEEFRETKEWICATDWDSAFSFVNLCELFGFDPDCLRKALLDWERSEADRPRQRFRPAILRAA
ncbi:MAG: hypothetical protein KatS3mg076_2221 [Candidatus Binatia bacterium]|nr:MAG: hypothetical protein KatS3mg076_2221 [Candidatus Binatia bacterium]